jgi:hypothetical protein
MTDADLRSQLDGLIRQMEDAKQRLVSLGGNLTQTAQPLMSALGQISPQLPAQFTAPLSGITFVQAEILKKLDEILGEVRAVFAMYEYVSGWREIHTTSTAIAGALTPPRLASDGRWRGLGADAYFQMVSAQNAAADRMSELAKKTAETLFECAKSMMALYAALGVILARILWATIKAIAAILALVPVIAAAIAAVGTGPGAGVVWALCAIAVTRCLAQLWMSYREILQSRALWLAALAAAWVAISQQWDSSKVLLTEGANQRAFRGGHWPQATSSSFDDRSESVGWAIVPPAEPLVLPAPGQPRRP